MTDNPCLRPACLSDVNVYWQCIDGKPTWVGDEQSDERLEACRKLYNAEWQKRGFERSP